MPIQPINGLEKKQNVLQYNTKTRLKHLAAGVAVGFGAGLVYYGHYKNLKGKKLLINSVELGSCIGLATDIFCMATEKPKSIK